MILLIQGLSVDHHESDAAKATTSKMEIRVEVFLEGTALAVFRQLSMTLYKVRFTGSIPSTGTLICLTNVGILLPKHLSHVHGHVILCYSTIALPSNLLSLPLL